MISVLRDIGLRPRLRKWVSRKAKKVGEFSFGEIFWLSDYWPTKMSYGFGTAATGSVESARRRRRVVSLERERERNSFESWVLPPLRSVPILY